MVAGVWDDLSIPAFKRSRGSYPGQNARRREALRSGILLLLALLVALLVAAESQGWG